MKTGADGAIETMPELLTRISGSGIADKSNSHLRLWFRGQPDADWLLRPGVYRKAFPARNEADRLRIERHLNQDFRVQAAALVAGEKNDQEIYFLQQHYGIPTRLLDWTTNPLAALLFAVIEEPKIDGAVFMMDAYQLAVCQGAEDAFMGVATSRHGAFKRALRPICSWESEDLFPAFVIPVRPNHFDRRMMLQRSGLTFHPPKRPELTKAENTSLRKFVVPAKAKEAIAGDLARLGVDPYGVYGDMASLARTLRRAYGIPG